MDRTKLVLGDLYHHPLGYRNNPPLSTRDLVIEVRIVICAHDVGKGSILTSVF